MNLLDYFKVIKIDPKKLIIGRDSGTNFQNNTEITPIDYLEFSKMDYKEGSTRGYINSITNAKRSIDCSIDNLLNNLGIDTNRNEYLDSFCKNRISDEYRDYPYKLKILSAFDIVPIRLISELRELRNKIEHNYIKIEMNDCSKYIEIAELFNNSIQKINDCIWGFEFYSNELEPGRLYNKISIYFDEVNHSFEINGWKQKEKLENTNISNDSDTYYYLLNILLKIEKSYYLLDAVKDLLQNIGHPIPRKDITVTDESSI